VRVSVGDKVVFNDLQVEARRGEHIYRLDARSKARLLDIEHGKWYNIDVQAACEYAAL
jgi:hypothetical protein